MIIDKTMLHIGKHVAKVSADNLYGQSNVVIDIVYQFLASCKFFFFCVCGGQESEAK